MEDAEIYNYAPTVAQLLTIGKPEVFAAEDWPNYLELGLNAEHISDLISMATDERLHHADEEGSETWAPYHAWRALGQLHAETAIEPLLSLYKTQEDNEWVMEELPEVYGMIGPVALPALAAFIADLSNGEWPRVFAVGGIEKIGKVFPDARSASIEILSKQLEAFQKEEYELNAALIRSLVDLEAKEAAPLMERAFAANAVEAFLMDDWEDVQETLGLLSPEEVVQIRQREEAEDLQVQQELEKRWREREAEGSLPVSLSVTPSDAYWRQTPRTSTAKKAKQKNKESKQARKKNRKR